MENRIVVTGGRPLNGAVRIPAAKNSVLPLLAAALLCNGTVRFLQVPHLADVDTSVELLQGAGCTARWQGSDITVQGVPSTCAKRAVTSYSSCPRYSIRLWVVFSSSACRAASPTASPACTCSAVSMRTEGNTLRSCSISCSACCRVIDPPCAVFSSLFCTPVSPFFSMVRPGAIILFFAWLRQTCCRLSRHRKILEK